MQVLSDELDPIQGKQPEGIAVTKNVPLKLDSTNIKWKQKFMTRLSSPVVYDNQIWVTSANLTVKSFMQFVSIFRPGKIIYDIKVFTLIKLKEALYKYYASPTPCNRKRMYMFIMAAMEHLHKHSKRFNRLETH